MANYQKAAHNRRDYLKTTSGNKELSKSAKQVRARLRRRAEKLKGTPDALPTEAEVALLYRKPLEEWDEEELAMGRPRAVDGTFRGHSPRWVTREMQEEALRAFERMLISENNLTTLKSARLLGEMLDDLELDENGRPIVSPTVKSKIAMYMMDRTLGKPTAPVAVDMNVHLEGILARVMIDDESGQLSSSHTAVTVIEAEEEDDEDEKAEDD